MYSILKFESCLQLSSGKRKTAVVNISSLLGSIESIPFEGQTVFPTYPYRTSKAALNMVSKMLAVDLKPEAISFIALHPGWVQTDLGGPNATLTVQTSVSKQIKVIQSIDDSQLGKLINLDGSIIPY